MIIMKIHGGLGNQMFQYALGRCLAIRKKTDLKLDLSFYSNKNKRDTKRDFQLTFFNAHLEMATEQDLKQMLGLPYLREPNRLLNRFGINFLSHYYAEKSHNFNSEVFQLGDDSFLEGYWQSPQYFEEFAPIIRQDFTFKEPLLTANNDLAIKIATTESIAIHIRRGDYLNNPLHDVFDMSYLEKSIAMMVELLGNNIELFIFSDDLKWCQENLYSLYPHLQRFFCDGGDTKEDLQLMSSCKHFIIANSSFSWWAAWLGHFTNKKVIAPQKWFNSNRLDSSDILPKEWIKL